MSETSDLQSRVEALEARVAQLEGKRFDTSAYGPRPVSPVPPPIVRQTRLQDIHQAAPSTYEAVDNEREFGAKILPWIGAIAVIAGLGYFVNYAIQKDLITPTMQMAGAAIFSLIIAMIGMFVARNSESNNRLYGNLLVGLGSCGLYMTAAGGYAGWKLISGEAMIGSFVILSLINLGYGFWRSLPPFVLLGTVGGAIASGMVASKSEFELAAGILGMVGASALAILVARKQPRWIAAIWSVGSISLLTWSTARGAYGTHYLVGAWLVVTILAMVLGYRRAGIAFEPVSPSILSLASIGHVFVCADERWQAGLIAVAFAAMFAALAYRFPESRKNFAVLAAVYLGTIAPFGFDNPYYIVVFSAIGLALFVVALRSFAEIAALGAVNLAIATLMYLGVSLDSTQKFLLFEERWTVAYLAAIAIASSYLVYRLAKEKLREIGELDTMALFYGAGAVWLLSWRFVVLEIGHGDLGRQWVTIAWGICALASIAIGAWGHLKPLRFAGLGILMASFARVIFVELSELGPIYKVMLLVGLGLLALGISYGFYIRPGRKGPIAH